MLSDVLNVVRGVVGECSRDVLNAVRGVAGQSVLTDVLNVHVAVVPCRLIAISSIYIRFH